MADNQQHHRLACMQPQGVPTEDGDSVEEIRSRRESTDCPEMDREMPGQDQATLPASQRQREKSLGGLVQQFEQAVGDFQQVLSPGVAGIPDKLTSGSTLLESSLASPLYTVSSPTSPIFPGAGAASPGVRVSGNDKAHVELVTQDILDERIMHLTHAMNEHFAQEFASFELRLHSCFEALGARCEALEKKGGEHAQDLERHRHDQCAFADRVNGLQRQCVEQEQRVAQELEQLGHVSGQALDSLRALGPRLDKMSQDQKESVEALELANQQMVARLETFTEQTKAQEQECKAFQQQVKDMNSQMQQVCETDTRLAQHIDTELERLEGMLHGPAPSVESDLQKMFQDMEDFKGKLHVLNQVQIQDQNDFNEVDQFQKELHQRVNDEIKLLRGKVDEVTDMVQEDLMGLHSKLCTDLEHLQADREAVPSVTDLPSPSIAAAIPKEPEEAADDDDCRWELQHRALEIEPATNETHSEAEQGARTPPSVQPPEHNEQPPKVVCGNPPPLVGGNLTARLEPKRAFIFQHTLPAEVTESEPATPQPRRATFGLAELQRKMDEKLDTSLRHVDEYITRHEAQLQQMGEVGNQYSAVQRSVDDLREEVSSVRVDLDMLRTCKVKVLDHLRAIPDF